MTSSNMYEWVYYDRSDVDLQTYRFKHNLLYRDRAGYSPKLREFMENIATGVYSNTFSDRTLKVADNSRGKFKIVITL